MTNKTSGVRRSGQDAATVAGGVAGAIALAFCCGGAILAAAFGLSAVAALFVNPWFLIPVVLIAAGAVYRRANRKEAACDVPATRGKADDER